MSIERVEMTDDTGQRRGYSTRAGIVLLNLIMPGLGLLRLRRWRTGGAFLLMPFALVGLVAFGMGHVPITGHRHAVFALAVLLIAVAAIFVLPALLTWRASRFRSPPAVWSRWYSLTAIAVLALALLQIVQTAVGRFYRPFQVPSESMMPTLYVGDRFMADMRWRGPLRRGDIVLVDGPGGVRIVRIVGLPGDRVAMRGGIPLIDGLAAVQYPQGHLPSSDDASADRMTVQRERLPGEPSSHQVLDAGVASLGDIPDVVVPAGHLFLLGDHRDRSADSRMTIDEGGIGMVPMTAIIGRPLYIHWSSNPSRTGLQISPLS